MEVHVSIVFEPRDLWVGLYWDRKESVVISRGAEPRMMARYRELAFYVCVLPCFPLVLRVREELEVPSCAG